ncbi:MAG: FAD-binding oxidoreductase [Paracoccaceae bacterium]|nr:FAD-binding oxidoreductase [Paracoccaceae bacterium]
MSATQFRKPTAKVVNEIKNVVGTASWKSPQDGPSYFEDPRGRFEGKGSLIVTPQSAREVSKIVQLCNQAGVGIIPYSGGTGVVAGQLSIESGNAIILSLEKMNKVRRISADDSMLIAEAGCILENIHNVANDHGMDFPLNMASKGSCCIGGNLATNAGGIQVLRHGNARDLCLGIEAVLPDGTILNELAPLHKNNTGYDVRHLMIGSEGTLGIITAAALKLKPIDPETGTAFLAITSPEQGLKVLREMKKHLGESISALELMSGFGVRLVCNSFPKLRNPLSETSEWNLLLEVSGPAGINKLMETALETCFEQSLIHDAVIAQSQSQRENLWELRENTPESNRMVGAFCSSDTSVAVSNIDVFIRDTIAAISAINSDVRINSYGHLGDGNIHHNVFPPEGISKSEFVSTNPEIIDSVRMAINETTHKHGGSISAEHGIGRLKVNDAAHYLGEAKKQMIRSIKTAIDPNNIMNPGALFNDTLTQ